MNPKFTSLSIAIALASTFILNSVSQANLSALKDCTETEFCFTGSTPNAAFKMIHTPKKDRVILLMHGLSDSPYFMKDVAARFYNQGIDVIAPMLDGHGTKPEDLLRVTSEQWQNTSEKWFKVAQKNWKTVSLGGFSTGGMLSIRLAANHPKQVRDIQLFVPAIKIANKNAYQSCPYTEASILAEKTPGAAGEAMKKKLLAFLPDGEWINPTAPTTAVKYGPMTTGSVCALYKLNFFSSLYLAKVKAPINAVISSDDTTTDAMVALEKLAASKSSKVRILVLASDKTSAPFEKRAQELKAQRPNGLSIDISIGRAVEHGSMPVLKNDYNKGLENPQFEVLESFIFGAR